MPKASVKAAGEYRSIFGYGYDSRSPEAVGSPSEEPAQLEAATDLAKRYGLSDPEMLLHELNCLAGEWQTASGVYRLDDRESLEVGRQKIHSAVSCLLEVLENNELPYRRIERSLNHEHGFNIGVAHRLLKSLQHSAARSRDDGSPQLFKSRRQDTDEHRGWLVCRLAYLYETQTGELVRAYVDGKERTGNDGSDFVVAAFFMLTEKAIKKSTIERLLREDRKPNPTPEPAA